MSISKNDRVRMRESRYGIAKASPGIVMAVLCKGTALVVHFTDEPRRTITLRSGDVEKMASASNLAFSTAA